MKSMARGKVLPVAELRKRLRLQGCLICGATGNGSPCRAEFAQTAALFWSERAEAECGLCWRICSPSRCWRWRAVSPSDVLIMASLSAGSRFEPEGAQRLTLGLPEMERILFLPTRVRVLSQTGPTRIYPS